MKRAQPLYFPLSSSAVECINNISASPGIARLIVYGSYAKGCSKPDSDIDIAVFYNLGHTLLLEEYRALVRLCATSDTEIEIQVFDIHEADDPCGIIEEILAYGIDLPVGGASVLKSHA